MILKLIGSEISLTTAANTVDSAVLVRILNDSGAAVLITRRDSSNNVLGSCTLANNEVNILSKLSTDTLEAAANVKAVSIAYTVG